MTVSAVQIDDLVLLREYRRRLTPPQAPLRWQPNPGPQAAAFASEADQIGYGGAAGGGKSDLLLGLAGLQHRRAILFRRVFPSLTAMVERSREIYNPIDAPHSADAFNEQLHRWRLADGRLVYFRSCQYEADLRKYQGQPHDLIGIDEATEFPEAWVRRLAGWNRTTVPGQRCRLVLTFNPPMDDEQGWVVSFFGPWLDPDHPDPADDGEIRYAYMDDEGREHFARTVADIPLRADGTPRLHKARTFFHASLQDNPALVASGYEATIDTLPEPLRSLLKGNFTAGRGADPWKVIPAAWVKAAQARTSDAPGAVTGLGLDVARGGADQTTVARVRGNVIEPVIAVPGSATPDGPSAAALALQYLADDAPVGVDVIGVGASAYDSLVGACRALPLNASAGSDATDRSGKVRMANLRAAMWWAFREALDPEHGADLVLPDDPQLRAELTAPRFSVRAGRIVVESKDELRKRLGRSTDRADAVIMAWWAAQQGLPLLLFADAEAYATDD